MTETVQPTADLIGLPQGSAVLQLILTRDEQDPTVGHLDARMVLVGATKPDINNPAHRVAAHIQKLLPGILAIEVGAMNPVQAQDIEERLAIGAELAAFEPPPPIELGNIGCQMIGTVTPPDDQGCIAELGAPYEVPRFDAKSFVDKTIESFGKPDPYGNKVYQD